MPTTGRGRKRKWGEIRETDHSNEYRGDIQRENGGENERTEYHKRQKTILNEGVT